MGGAGGRAAAKAHHRQQWRQLFSGGEGKAYGLILQNYSSLSLASRRVACLPARAWAWQAAAHLRLPCPSRCPPDRLPFFALPGSGTRLPPRLPPAWTCGSNAFLLFTPHWTALSLLPFQPASLPLCPHTPRTRSLPTPTTPPAPTPHLPFPLPICLSLPVGYTRPHTPTSHPWRFALPPPTWQAGVQQAHTQFVGVYRARWVGGWCRWFSGPLAPLVRLALHGGRLSFGCWASSA